MNLGFTGTRMGFTPMQDAVMRKTLFRLLETEDVKAFHHGLCRGGDQRAHELIRELSPSMMIVGHPMIGKGNQALYLYEDCQELRADAEPLVRDQAIVDEAGLLVVGPKDFKEVRRGSGTWATYRMALKRGIPIIIVWPDGKIGRR